MKPTSLTWSLRRRALAMLGGALGLSLWLWAQPAAGTTLLALDLPTLTASAERVLVGTVEKTDAHYLGEGGSYIVTDVTIRCERELLGVAVGSRFVVRHLGGAVGELGQRVHGEASYRVGEQVLLFASERSGAFYALGMAQGAMHVYRDASGTARVDVQLSAGELIGPSGQAVAPAVSGRPLDDVLAQVRSLLAARAAKSAPKSTPAPKGGQP